MIRALLLSIVLLAGIAEARPVRFIQKRTPSNYQLFQNGAIGEGQVRWKQDTLIPPNVVTRYKYWQRWVDYRKAQFESGHPLERPVNKYFSKSTGDDGNDCTEAEPCETLTKADTFDTVNTALNFKAGDTWEECVQVTLAAANMTVKSYGSGNKPVWSCFTGKINSGAAWSVFSGNTYSIANTQDGIGWLRNADDKLGDTATSPFYLASSNAFSDTGITFPAWFKDDATDTLYVNLGGTNPNTVNFEYTVNNTLSGVEINATSDGARVDNIRFDGFSLSRTTPNHNLGYAVMTLLTGTNSAYVTNSEAYYCSAHCFGQLSSGANGGLTMWRGNKAGYPMFNGASSETIYNSYSLGSHEGWFIENEANYGATPMSTWGVSTDKVQSQAFFGHTAGGISGIHVAYNNTLPDTHHPVAEISGFNNCVAITSEAELESVRCFVVKNTQQHATVSGGALYSVAFAGYNIVMNNRIAVAPRNTGGLALSLTRPVHAFFIQNHLKIDYSQWGTGARGLYNTTSSDNIVYFWHNFFDLIDTSGTGASQFGIDYDTRGGAGDSSPNSTAYNNILSNDANSTYAGWYFGLNNEPTKMAGNAVFKITDTVTGNPSGYGDTTYVTLSVLPAYNLYDALLDGTASTQVPFKLSHDIDGKLRKIATDIGSTEY